MPTRRDALSLVPAVAGGVASTTASINGVASASELPVDIKRTRIGDLRYEAGFPTAETAKKLYDELDFQRAVLAYQYADPLVAMSELNTGLQQIGGRAGAHVCRRAGHGTYRSRPHGVARCGIRPSVLRI
jgi:hypothetical protein